ncbi:MAG: transcription-repair coupling factor [candidate division Zixibacteria bacterium]|nr:transcription-repair coupling factor [candidate division Zixibacteria bacterium]
MYRIDLIRKIFKRSSQVAQFLEHSRTDTPLQVSGLVGSARAFLLAELFSQTEQPLLVVMPTAKLADNLLHDLREICGEEAVYRFPSWGVNPYHWLAPPQENIAERIETVWTLSQRSPLLVITSPGALTQPTIALDQLRKSCFTLALNQEYDLQEITAKLTRIGYERKPMTEEVGTFSVRGGILDVFPFTATEPVRCEFFGDLIESIRSFSVLSQRSLESIDQMAIIPRREIVFTNTELEEQIDALGAEPAKLICDKCLGGFGYPGLEWIASMFNKKRTFLFDYLPTATRIYLGDPDLIKARLEGIATETENLREQLTDRLPTAPRPDSVCLPPTEILNRFHQGNAIEEIGLGSTPAAINFGIKEHPSFNGQIKLLRQALRDYLAANQSVFIISENEVQRQRLSELLSEYADAVHFVVSQIQTGFQFANTDLILLTDHQIFERRFIRRRTAKFKEGTAISSYNALSVGDFVVHIDYGIGRYRGLEEIKVGDQRRECLLIKYAEDARLYVPIEEFGRVQKYVGKDGKPTLTRLGGKSWEKIKARTKKAIADMAEELLKLYAARKSRPGLTFAADNEWMRELEASFPYEETPDQLMAIEAIKRDMEKPTPTDRLVCGDVGFGKTEVAIRAALKAVACDKQVAVLVPTTILAQQHLATFRDRLQQFPVRIEMLSRFKSRKQQREIIADLKNGKVDVVIGTHRLFGKDVVFPDLGLLVIDEEHRFGVAHKEKLKKIRATVDCLALSATPIPRTLHMSLLGVRDISLINTPPKFRQAIVTEIAEFDPKIIHDAIHDEIGRRGQIYFVHNRVQSIVSMYHYLAKLLKPIRIAVAHGQMPEQELEEVMVSFLEKDYDVLLSTSIIESGIDIPSVNTIVINRADRFGLAQLYQLRGRVGRSTDRAFAYLLVPPVKLLTDTARKRLKAIEQHTELGSGFHLAMKDMEIRGAGNLLGPQQHGFIEEVGFDLYCRLLEEAVAELKGEPVTRIPEVKVEFDDDIYIPDVYIEDSTQRVEIYRKVADVTKIEQLDSIRSELIDRFGKFDTAVENLLDLAAVKLSAATRKIARVNLRGRKLTLVYDNGQQPRKKDVERFCAAAKGVIEFDATGDFTIRVAFSLECSRPPAETKKLLQLL